VVWRPDEDAAVKRSIEFDPKDYLSDPAVRAMSLEERGAYTTLLFQIWHQKEPGVVKDEDRSMAFLAWATPEEWARVKPAVMRAFDTESRPGWWVQKRMAKDSRRLTRAQAALRERGEKGARSRWKRDAQRGFPQVEMDLGETARARKPLETGESHARGIEQRMAPAIGDDVARASTSGDPAPAPRDVRGLGFDLDSRDGLGEEPPSSRAQREVDTGPQRLSGILGQVFKAAADRSTQRGAAGPPVGRETEPRQNSDTQTPGLDTDRVQVELNELRIDDSVTDRDPYYRFAGWLWKTGTHDNEVICELLRDAVSRDPGNWYAYYAVEGQGRLGAEAAARERIAARVKRELTAQDQRFLGQVDR